MDKSTQQEKGKGPNKIFSFLENFRKSLIRTGMVILVFSFVGYFFADPIMKYLYEISRIQLAAYTLPETFISMITICLAFGLVVSMPYIFYTILWALPTLFESFSKKAALVFLVSSVGLFYSGALFCLKITLPYGVKFLLGFQTTEVQAIISVKKYVSFCLFFIFGFGIIFLLPLAMILMGRIGIIRLETLTRYRRYAVLIITIVSAILTPTPDVLNLALMAVPLYLLFETGIIGMRIWKK